MALLLPLNTQPYFNEPALQPFAARAGLSFCVASSGSGMKSWPPAVRMPITVSTPPLIFPNHLNSRLGSSSATS